MATEAGSNTESEWISISKKKSGGKGNNAKTAKLLAKGHAALSTSNHDAENVGTVAAAIRAGMLSVKDSTYYQFLVSYISGSVGAGFDNIIAFGLGNLTSETSKLQLVLYLCLCNSLLAAGASTTSKSIYDPCISDFDRSVLEVLQVPVLSENTKGKHIIGGRGTTLIYLPHCPYRLYCNILWVNWDRLDRLYMLGNSFQSYSIRRMDTAAAPARHPKTVSAGSKKNVKNAKNEKATESVAMDVTDTVAMLTPFITEVDLWPAATHNICVQAPKEEKKRKSITISDEILAQGGTEVDSGSAEAVQKVPALDRSVFLKEAKTMPALRYLENAMCDMSLMYFPAASLRAPGLVEVLLHNRATEAQIDEAAAQDDELF